ncbi:MAG: replication initiation protein [Bacteroidota bacterium]
MQASSPTPSHSLVVKSNQLINARYSLTVAEIRLFLMMVAQVEKDDQDFKPYRIRIQDYAKAVGTQSKSHYKEIREAAQNLISRIADLPRDDGGWLKVAFLSSAEYFKGEGMLELCFDPKLKPYLLELKSRFTAYDIRNVLTLQSSYSIRIYELLKQFEKIGERTFRVDQLKEVLGISSRQYKRYNDFKRFVIQQAYQDLKRHTDINFEYEEIKEGRRIASIRFIIQRQLRAFGEVEIAPDQGLVSELKEMGLTQKQAEKFVKQQSREQILQAIAYTQKQYRAGKIKSSIGGYLKKILEEAVLTETAFEAKEKENTNQLKLKKEKKRASAKEVARLKEEFRNMREAELARMLSKAKDKDWQKFSLWAEENPYIKARVFTDGTIHRGSKEVLEWFKSFLEERLPKEDTAFAAWMKQQLQS